MNNQFMMDSMNNANAMIAQLVCEQNGIDYNQLVQVGAQQQIQQLMQMEQAEQLSRLMNKHYGGNTGGGVMSKIREAITGEKNNVSPMAMQMAGLMPMNPMMQQMPMQPMVSPHPNGAAFGQAFQQQASGDVIIDAPKKGVERKEFDTLKDDVEHIKAALAFIAQKVS
ncbi:MAG: hypothetical protein ACRC5C_13170 [Bacilli bacterium]